jgi:hypothetical protein
MLSEALRPVFSMETKFLYRIKALINSFEVTEISQSYQTTLGRTVDGTRLKKFFPLAGNEICLASHIRIKRTFSRNPKTQI